MPLKQHPTDPDKLVYVGRQYDLTPPAAQPAQEPVAWVDLLKEADQIVRNKSLWKKFIDGTPLSNDIAVWMADFAQEKTTPPQRPWVGLMRGVRVEGDTVIISVKGGNDAARELCGALIKELEA